MNLCEFVHLSKIGQNTHKPSHTKGFRDFCPDFCPILKLCEIDEILHKKWGIPRVWWVKHCDFVQFPLILSTDEISHRNPVIPRVWGVFYCHFVQNFKKSCQKNFLKIFRLKFRKSGQMDKTHEKTLTKPGVKPFSALILFVQKWTK